MIERFRLEVKAETKETAVEKLDQATTAFLKATRETLRQPSSENENGPHWECTDDVVFAVKSPAFVYSGNQTQKITGYRGRRVMVYRQGEAA